MGIYGKSQKVQAKAMGEIDLWPKPEIGLRPKLYQLYLVTDDAFLDDQFYHKATRFDVATWAFGGFEDVLGFLWARKTGFL